MISYQIHRGPTTARNRSPRATAAPLPPRNAQLLQRYRKRETYLEVNLGHVNEFRPDLLDMLTLRPVEFLPLFEQVRPESLNLLVVTRSTRMLASSGLLPHQ